MQGVENDFKLSQSERILGVASCHGFFHIRGFTTAEKGRIESFSILQIDWRYQNGVRVFPQS